MTEEINEEGVWSRTKSMLQTEHVELGDYFSYQVRNTPRRLLYSLAYYKFAAKMLQDQSRVLELGCGEGLGGCILSEGATGYLGVDMDVEMVASAKSNFENERRAFLNSNFLGNKMGSFDAIVSLDVIEHILPVNDDLFWETTVTNLTSKGTVIIGTPNITSQKYASEVTRSGHINLYDYKRMKAQASKWFDYHFLFSANDEVVHTGFSPMAHYLIVVACSPKK